MTAIAVAAPPTKEQFSQQVNQVFRSRLPSGSEFEMLLVDFHDLLDTESQETFTILFRAPADTEPEQATYTVSNPAIGEQAIFLVPVKRDDEGLYFEAVFNRFKK